MNGAPWPGVAGLDEAQREQIRVRELRKFFQPAAFRRGRSFGATVGQDGDEILAAEDATFTALAQLAVFKVQCERAFINIVDHDFHYIIAEAVRSQDLTSVKVNDEGESVYVGTKVAELDEMVCPTTMKVFTSVDASNDIDRPPIKADRASYVISDMSKVELHSGRPFVCGPPHLRFYAGVPIRTPSGYTIGSLCVVDPKSRAGLSPEHLVALQQVSDTIMYHLELVTAKQKQGRAERLLESLGLFVEGKSSIRDWWMEAATYSRANDPALLHLTIEERAILEFGQDPVGQNQARNSACNLEAKKEKSTALSQKQNPEDQNMLQSSNSLNRGRSQATSPGDTQANNMQPSESNTKAVLQASNEVETTLSRASVIIREAMDLDGVLFLETGQPSFRSPQSDAHASKRRRLGQESSTEVTKHSNDMNNIPSNDGDYSGRRAAQSNITEERFGQLATVEKDTAMNEIEEESKIPSNSHGLGVRLSGGSNHPTQLFSRILAFSTRKQSSIADDTPATCQYMYPDVDLRELFRRYPRGRILNIDSDGSISSSDDYVLDGTDIKQNLSSFPKKRRFSEMEDNDKLRHRRLLSLLPGARSIAFFPLWDPQSESWLAGGFAWTTDPTRCFYREELVYLKSFGNSASAEVSRLRTIASDRSKSDFISSVSHEFRSPLHGVLASAELLQETSTGHAQNDLIRNIEVCGTTLLDTMDGLLNFAKINHLSKSDPKRRSLTDASSGTTGLTSDVDLALVIEDVVSACQWGHTRRMSTSQDNKDRSKLHNDTLVQDGPASERPCAPNFNSKSSIRINTVLSLDWRSNWIFKTEPGAWKRIIMNLFGNALKYTEAGFVQVELQSTDIPSSVCHPKRTRIAVIISDSGKGMSTQYLRHQLYKPFSQEDSLTAGTGLGLSIVKQLVDSLGGDIEIQSESGVGTKVTVSVVLDRAKSSNLAAPYADARLSNHKLRGLRLGLLASKRTPGDIANDKSSLALRLLFASLSKIATEWLGMEVLAATDMEQDTADFWFILDSDLNREPGNRQQNNANTKPSQGPWVIVLNESPTTKSSSQKDDRRIVVVSQPVGPRKLRNTLMFCLEQHNALVANSAFDESTVETNATRRFSESKVEARSEHEQARLMREDRDDRNGLENKNPVSHSGSGKPKILVVEDNDINLKILATYMRRLNYDYECASNGLEALEIYKKASPRFDIVLTDISMPILDGVESARAMRAYERESCIGATPIIALTGLGSGESQNAGVFDVYLTKPTRMQALKEVIEKRLQQNFSEQRHISIKH